MGDPLISDDIIQLGTVTSRGTPVYPHDNVKDLWHLKKRYRGPDITKNDWLLKCDFGAQTEVVAVVLNDVNYDEVQIQGNATDSWGSPSYDGSIIEISLDTIVNRYKVYIPLTGFDYQWMRLFIPTTANAVGDYVDKWETGTWVPLASTATVPKNSYERGSTKPFQDLALSHGGFERISLGDHPGWMGRFKIDKRAESDEEQYWTFNLLDIAKPHIFYENRSVTNKVYLCLRDDSYRGELVHHGLVVGNAIRFKELI